MSDHRQDLLLHVCCGPCAEWPLSSLKDEDFDITAFFFNPNIHPQFEQKRRRDNAAKVMELRGIPFLQDDAYMEEMWLCKAWEEQTKYQSRCEMCYDIRMMRTAEEAKRLGIPSFSTTLLVSPYQNHEAIISSAMKASGETNIAFIYRDFRIGYRAGQDMAKLDGLYRQKYCGCIYSLEKSPFRDKIYKSFEGSDEVTSSFEGSEGVTSTVL